MCALYILYCVSVCDGLELRGLEVPSLAEMFSPVRLGCRFRLGTNPLHSVKWYKDDEEFYRFTPTERPSRRQFPLPGAYVELEDSDMHIVKLQNVSRLTAGVYRCEVSSEAPTFDSVHSSARMEVYALADRKPEIKLEKSRLFSGEEIVATCSSGQSYPQQKLLWFLNGIQVNSSCISGEKMTVTGSGLFRSYSTVRLATKGGPGPILLSCVAQQGPAFSPSRDYVDLSLQEQPNHQPFTDSSAGKPGTSQEQQCSFYSALKLALFFGFYAYAYINIYHDCIST